MIEPGKYHGVLQSIAFGMNKTDTPTLTTEWLIGEETRTVYTYFSPKAVEISMQKLSALGFNGDFKTPALTVTETELQCRHETYEGEPREKWDFANWGGSSMKEAPGATIASLNAQWKKTQGGTPPPVAKAKVKDPRTLCWDAFCKTCGSDDAAAKDWDRFISTNTTKQEADLTAQEWAQLTKLAEVPFA